MEVKMALMKNKYLEEYEKYKHVKVVPQVYKLKSNENILYEVLEVDEIGEQVYLKTVRSKNERTRTLHWCRKNLIPLKE